VLTLSIFWILNLLPGYLSYNNLFCRRLQHAISLAAPTASHACYAASAFPTYSALFLLAGMALHTLPTYACGLARLPSRTPPVYTMVLAPRGHEEHFWRTFSPFLPPPG